MGAAGSRLYTGDEDVDVSYMTKCEESEKRE